MRRRLLAVLLTTAAVTLGTTACEPPPRPPTIFPQDQGFTVADDRQVTGRRVALPLPPCSARPSDCNEVRLLNQLDGFDLDPTISVDFAGPVDLSRVGPSTVFVESLSDRARIPLVRLVWDPTTSTLYGHPRDLLREATRYRTVVTAALGGTEGDATFTTMSATTGLRQMRAQLDDGSAYTDAGIAAGAARELDFTRPDGTRTVYPAALVARVRRFNDVGDAGLSEETVFDSAPSSISAGTYAFGSFLSPSWLAADRSIPATPTRSGRPRARGSDEVGFALIVPSGTPPAGGWPIAVFGPGVTRSKYDVFLAADENLRAGIATIAIDPVGHAYGPRSSAGVDLVLPPASPRFSGFGRGFDQDGDGVITAEEGVSTRGQPAAVASVAFRDGLRQTALDNMALVRAIARGVDVDGNGTDDLRTDVLGYYAQSLGGIYGTMVMATDPRLDVGVLNVPGGPITEIARLSPGFRPRVATELRNRVPALLNGGVDGFTESLPLFPDPMVTAPAAGAVAIQQALARANWLNRSGSPEAFAPLLRLRPPPGAAVKRVIYQFAFGDQTVPNPASATLARAGALLDRTTFYRNDRTPTAGSDPHGVLIDPRITGRTQAQQQVTRFLESDGMTIVDPDGAAGIFEVPIADPATLERVNF